MKTINAAGRVALAASLAIMLAGTGTAMAESTALCDHDPGTGSQEICPAGHLISHVHETTFVAGFKISTPSFTVLCSRLFLGDVKSSNNLGAPLVVEGGFSYSGCIAGQLTCTVTEVNPPTKAEILKKGHETATVTVSFAVHIVCGPFFNCTYNGAGLLGTSKGPLLAKEENGETVVEGQTLHKESGTFCPAEATVDTVSFPLGEYNIAN